MNFVIRAHATHAGRIILKNKIILDKLFIVVPAQYRIINELKFRIYRAI